MILFDLSEFLNNLNEKLNNFVSNYNDNPIFWVITALIIFLIGCWAIRYFGRK